MNQTKRFTRFRALFALVFLIVALLLSYSISGAFANAEPVYTSLTLDVLNSSCMSTVGDYYILGTGYYRLAEDITLPRRIEVSGAGTEVVLDLAGHTLSTTDEFRTSTENVSDDGQFYQTQPLRVYGSAHLTVEDSSGDNSGVITGGSGTTGGAINAAQGNFTLNGGTIKGNVTRLPAGSSATYGGGAVYIGDGRTFTMNGGVIGDINAAAEGEVAEAEAAEAEAAEEDIVEGDVSEGGSSEGGSSEAVPFEGNLSERGGAIFSNGGTVIINGGTIIGNVATDCGGGIFAAGECTVTIGENAELSHNEAGAHGGAVYCNNSETVLTVTGSTFTKNIAGTLDETKTYNGGAIYLANGTASITGTTFTENHTASYGGAIHTSFNRNMTVSGCTFANNTASHGAAIAASDGSTVIFSDNTVTGNTVTGNGGCFYANNATYTVSGTEVTGNSANQGGVMYAVNNAEITISGSEFSRNNAATGGAIYADNITLTISENTVINENSVTGHGGAVFAGASGVKFTVSDTQICQNTAANSGGGVYADAGSTVEFSAVTMNNNSATGNGGAMHAGSGTSVTVFGSQFSDNTAGNGGGALYTDSATLNFSDSQNAQKKNVISGNTATTGNGGAINATATTITLSGTTLTNNVSTAGTGGAIRTGDGSTVQLTDVTMNDNSANGEGGAVNADSSSILFTNTTAEDNVSNSNGGVFYLSDTELEIQSGSFTNNSAVNGGVIYANGASTVTVEESVVFSHNEAGVNGGAIYVNNAEAVLTVNGAPFTNNRAGAEGISGKTYNGGAIYFARGTATIIGSTFTANQTAGYGGVIHTSFNKTMTVSGCTFENNNSSHGAAIAASDGSTVIFSDNTVTGNTVTGNGGCFYANNATYTISGTEATGNSAKQGGVMYAVSKATVTISGSEFSNNTAGSGGAFYTNSATLTFSDDANAEKKNVISGNTATTGNGGAVNATATTLTLSGTTITNNKTTAGSGGAIRAVNGSTLQLTDVTMNRNTSKQGGGVVNADGSSVTVTNTTADHNVSNSNGGVFYLVNTNLALEGGSFTNNSAPYGGVIYTSQNKNPETPVTLTVSGGTFTGNKATGTNQNVGGGVIQAYHVNIEITGEPVFENNTTRACGGVLAYRCDDAAYNGRGVTVSGGTFMGNKAPENGSARGNGGAIYIRGVSQTAKPVFNIIKATFEGNQSYRYAGAVFCSNVDGTIGGQTAGSVVFDGNKCNMATEAERMTGIGAGGAMALDAYSDFTVLNTRFVNNVAAGSAGAIRVLNKNTRLTIEDGTEIVGNQARQGGASHSAGTFIMHGGLIQGNTVTNNGGALYLGGVYSDNGADETFTFTMTGGTITGNTAGADGGGLYIFSNAGSGAPAAGTYSGARVDILSGTISNNTAKNGGGIAVVSRGPIAYLTLGVNCVHPDLNESGGFTAFNYPTVGADLGTAHAAHDHTSLAGLSHASCPVITGNTVSGTGGGIYVDDGSSVAQIAVYCLNLYGNTSAVIDQRAAYGLDFGGGEIVIGDNTYSAGQTAKGNVIVKEGIRLQNGEMTVSGTMTNPKLTEDILSTGTFVDNRKNTDGVTYYKVHFYENFRNSAGQLSKLMIARQFPSDSRKNEAGNSKYGFTTDGDDPENKLLYIHDGYTLVHWNTQSDDIGTEYTEGASYNLVTLGNAGKLPSNDQPLALYAIWERITGTVLVSRVTDGQWFTDFVENTNSISRDSAFTARLAVLNYVPNEYDAGTLMFSENLPQDTTIILKTGDKYWHYRVTTANLNSLSLTEFTAMGGSNLYEGNTGSVETDLVCQLIVDFSQTDAPLSAGSLTTTLKLTPVVAQVSTWEVPASVTLKDVATFTTSATPSNKSASISLNYTASPGKASIWNNRDVALVLTARSTVPADLTLTVNDTNYRMNPQKQFIIPLGAVDDKTLTVTLNSLLFAPANQTYTFDVDWYVATGKADLSPLNGSLVAETTVNFTCKKDAVPSIKMTTQKRLYVSGDTLTVTVQKAGIPTGATVTATLQKKGAREFVNVAGVASQSVTGSSVSFDLTGQTAGSYRVLVLVQQDRNTLLEVPYYIVMK